MAYPHNPPDSRPTPLTASDIPVPLRTDIFIHDLEPLTLEALHQALAQGLRVCGLDFGGDDDSTVVLRFSRMPPDSEMLE